MTASASLTPAYNYAPSLGLLLTALGLALLPVLVLMLRHPRADAQQRLRRLVWITTFLTFDLIIFGAFTRLTDSGLGCPDWPGCYGQSNPLLAHAQISSEQAAAPQGPVTHVKAWIEMIHRYWASAVGALIVGIAILVWRANRAYRASGTIPDHFAMASVPMAIFTVIWVCLQGAFGAWTVTMKLQPAIVSLHLLGGMILLCLLVAQGARMSEALQQRAALRDGLRTLLGFCFALLLVQTALGAWVSSNYAVLACQGFPQCNGQWLPPMDARQGFELWRALGQTSRGENLSLPALVAIHWMHRLMAVGVALALLILIARMRRVRVLRGYSNALFMLLLLQILSGVSNVVLGWPLIAALAHTAGAAAMLALLTAVIQSSRADDYTVSASRLNASMLDDSRSGDTVTADAIAPQKGIYP